MHNILNYRVTSIIKQRKYYIKNKPNNITITENLSVK